MSHFVMPSFEETDFVCNNCGHWFKGRDCGKGILGTLFGLPAGPLASHCPKCPKCGSHNTQQNPCVVY